MEEVRQVLTLYKALKAKTEYIKSYLECIVVINKKSSELLVRASQIPRDTSWNDQNIINIVELGERHRQIYDTETFKPLFLDLTEPKDQINEEIQMIETNLGTIINKNNSLSKELEIAKKSHIDSWLKNKDPWITDIKLKMAIKNMYNNSDKTSQITNMISIYNDKFLNTQDLYLQILIKFSKIYKSIFRELGECNIKIHSNVDNEKYFDANSTSHEITESKIITAYEGIIQNISTDLLKKDISICKNIEPVKYGMCKIRKGLTGDWMLFFISVTQSRFVHLFDISCLENRIINKYTDILGKLKQPRNRSLVSIFDSKKPTLNVMDERCILLLAEEIRNNIDKLIDNIYMSINLKDKLLKIDKERNIITIDEKLQNGISSLFGINIVRIQTFSLTSCYELYFSMKKNNEEKVVEDIFIEKTEEDVVQSKGVVVKIDEDNPWA